MIYRRIISRKDVEVNEMIQLIICPRSSHSFRGEKNDSVTPGMIIVISWKDVQKTKY